MTRRCTFVFAACAMTAAWAAPNGLPARPAPADYPAAGQSGPITVAADWMGADQVKSSFATDLSEYAVIEVAVYPGKDGKPVDISTIDFALRSEDRMVRPAEPRSIASIRQKRAAKRGDDVELYPHVGMTTGTWGTGVGVGVGVGRGRRRPPPAASDRDRRTMEQELDDKALQEGQATKPVAGYLYFPVGKKKASSYELEYQHNNGTPVKLKLTERP